MCERLLSPSEAMFAANRTTVAYSVFGSGVLDRAALATAFQALLRTYPVLAARVVSGPAGWVLEPAPRCPPLRNGTGLDLPAEGFEVVDADAVCGLDVAQRGDDFRLTWLTHHAIADAKASLRHLETLGGLYAETVRLGSPRALRAHPPPQSLEQFLAGRGFDVPETPAAPPARASADAAATTVPRVRHGRTRLTRDDTSGLFTFARRHGLTVHGIVCAAILLAARELSPADDPVRFGLASSVDLRTRAGQPLAADAGTVIQGLDTAVISVARGDDPVRLGAAVLSSLAANLATRKVHETFLRTSQVRPRGIDNLLMVTNWGRIPALPLPPGVEVHDFRASVRGLRMERAHTAPPAFFVTTCAGRLSIDHPAWVIDASDPTVAWRAALDAAFRRIAGRGSA